LCLGTCRSIVVELHHFGQKVCNNFCYKDYKKSLHYASCNSMNHPINTENWTDWSATWSKIILCDFKIEQVRSSSSIWNCKYDFRPNCTPLNSSTTLFHPFFFQWNCKTKLLGTKFATRFSLSLISPRITLVTLKKPWNLTGCPVLVFLSHWPGKRCNYLEQIIV